MSELHKKLLAVQSELRVPKNQYNNFGKYAYRNQEDILEALKPLLKKHGLLLTVSDEVVTVGEGLRFYVKATATVQDESGGDGISVTGFAREADTKKGMDDAQITGSASSYARKYALNGLFAIDDTKDADSHDNTTDKKPAAPKAKAENKGKGQAISEDQLKRLFALAGEHNISDANLKGLVQKEFGYKTRKDILAKDYEAICNRVVEISKEQSANNKDMFEQPKPISDDEYKKALNWAGRNPEPANERFNYKERTFTGVDGPRSLTVEQALYMKNTIEDALNKL